MHHRIDVNPGMNEIKAELYRVLASERVTASPSQAALLEVIVESHLAGDPADEKSIGPKAFPGFVAGNSTDVRIHAHKLRKTLAEYYSTDGSHDPVLIEVLKGRNYKVRATYNARSKALSSYKSALEMMSDVGSFPWKIIDALGHCVKAIEQDQEFAPAYGLYAEFVLCYGIVRRGELCKYGVAPNRGAYGELNIAREYAIQSLKLNRKNWRGWVALGICYACRSRWQMAERAFANALGIAPAEVPEDPWYLIYLIATRQEVEASTIAQRKWHSSSPRSFWKCLYFLMYYAIGTPWDHPFLDWTRELELKFSCGSTYLYEAIMGMWGMQLFGERLERSQRTFWRMKEPHVADKYHTIGGPGLWALIDSVDRNNEIAKKMAPQLTKSEYFLKWGEIEGVECVPLLYSLFSWGFYRRALESDELPEYDYIVNDWEAALAHLAAGNKNEAIRLLSNARMTRNPMTLWLHIWPFLNPLRREPDFIKLVKSMNLPLEVQRRVAKWRSYNLTS